VISFRYQDKGTVIHKLNPFCKLAWISGVLVLALLFDNPFYLLALFVSTLPLVWAARVWKEWASIMKLSFYLCLLVIVINALVSNQGSHVLYQFPFHIPIWGTPKITLEAILCGIGNAVRLTAIISAFAILTLTLHPDNLMLAMIKMRLPYKSVLVTSLATRFVPTLIDDIGTITDVQRSRGLELDKGGLPQKIRGRMTIIIPLLSNSLDRTFQVAEAMESRAFGNGAKRTFYNRIGMSTVDIAILAFLFLLLAMGISMSLLGQGEYSYYPTLGGVNIGPLEGLMLSILALLLFMMLPLAYLKRRIDLD